MKTTNTRWAVQIESTVRTALALVIVLGLVASASAGSRVFKVVQNSGRSFGANVELPSFPADSRLLAHLHVIPKGDAWDRNGRVVLNTPKGQVDLVKFITGFGGDTRHTVDVSNLRSLLKGKVTISGNIGGHIGNWGMDFRIEEVPGGNKGAPTVWAVPVVSSGTNWGDNGKRSFTVNLPKEPFEKIWLTYYATGHGGGDGKTCCEFKKRKHRIWVNGKQVLDAFPWRNYSKKFRSVNPRSGRFKGDRWSSDFARSGWLPGDRVHPFVIDVTSAIGQSPDGPHKIEFKIEGDLRGGHFTVSSFLSATAAPKK